jgi:hypothetical protein
MTGESISSLSRMDEGERRKTTEGKIYRNSKQLYLRENVTYHYSLPFEIVCK